MRVQSWSRLKTARRKACPFEREQNSIGETPFPIFKIQMANPKSSMLRFQKIATSLRLAAWASMLDSFCQCRIGIHDEEGLPFENCAPPFRWCNAFLRYNERNSRCNARCNARTTKVIDIVMRAVFILNVVVLRVGRNITKYEIVRIAE